MVRLDTTIRLLKWLFSPIKLYDGDFSDSSSSGGDFGIGSSLGSFKDAERGMGLDGVSSDQESGDGGRDSYDRSVQAAQDRYESSVADRIGVGLGGEVGYAEDLVSLWEAERQFEELDLAYEQYATSTSYGISGLDIGYAGSALNKSTDIDWSGLAGGSLTAGTFKQISEGRYDSVTTIGNNGSIMTFERTKDFFGNVSHTTTLSTPNSLGGYDVTIFDSGGDLSTSDIGDTIDRYSTSMNGQIVSHETEVALGNGHSFSFDTHYWNGNNTEFGFAAEIAADIAEFFGAKTKTVRSIAAVAETASIMYSTIMPSMQMFGVATQIARVNQLVGALMGVGSLLSIWDEINSINDMFGGENFYSANFESSLSNSFTKTNEEGEFNDLSENSNKTVTDDFIPSLFGYGINQSNTLLPNLKSPTQYIKPNLNQESNMQSQQAVFIDYRGGLSEVLAPNLIGANEGSIFNNININKGTMSPKYLGNVTTSLTVDTYNMFLPNDYVFTSAYSFNAVRLGNFIYMTVDNVSYPYIYQLDYQTLGRNCTLSDLVQASLDAPTIAPAIEDNLVSKVVVSIDVVDDDSPADTNNNVKVGDYIQIYYGETLVKTSIAMTADDISEGIIEVILDTYYPEEEEDLFQYRIKRGSSIIVPESNVLTLSNEEELERELWEEYVYAYTYYDSSSGFESAPIFSDSWLKKSQAITIADITYSTLNTVDYIRLYRIGGYSSSYRLIKEIDNNTVGGTTSYTDGCAEEYMPTLLDTQNLAVVEDLKGLIEHKGTLFAYKNNQVYFSRPGKANMWSNFNSIRVGGVVSGVASSTLGVIIFTENSQSYLLGGTDKYSFTLTQIAKSVGCITKQSIANYKNAAIWLDYEGLMMSIGSSVNNISKEKVNLSDIGNIVEAMVYDNVYYLVGENYTLSVDFRYNTPSFQKLDGNINHMLFNKGKIYVQHNTTWYKDAFAGIGTSALQMHYKAPMFIGNSYDILTEFNKINLTYKGSFIYKVYVDEIEVLSNTISSEKVKVEEIKLPTDSNEGLGLELELIGIGEIRAFRYIFSNVNVN